MPNEVKSCGECGNYKTGCVCKHMKELLVEIGIGFSRNIHSRFFQALALLCKHATPAKVQTPGEIYVENDPENFSTEHWHVSSVKVHVAAAFDAGRAELQTKVDELEAIIARKANEGLEAMGFDRCDGTKPGDGSCKAYNGPAPASGVEEDWKNLEIQSHDTTRKHFFKLGHARGAAGMLERVKSKWMADESVVDFHNWLLDQQAGGQK